MRVAFRKFGIVRRVITGIGVAIVPWLLVLGFGAAQYYTRPLRDPIYYDGKCPGWGDFTENCSIEKWQRWDPNRSGPQAIDGLFWFIGLTLFSAFAVVGSILPVSWPTLERSCQSEPKKATLDVERAS